MRSTIGKVRDSEEHLSSQRLAEATILQKTPGHCSLDPAVPLGDADLLRRGDRCKFLAGVVFPFVASQALHPVSRQNHHSLVVLYQCRSGWSLVLHEVNILSPRAVASEFTDEIKLAGGIWVD